MSLGWTDLSLGWTDLSLDWTDLSLGWTDLSLGWTDLSLGCAVFQITSYRVEHVRFCDDKLHDTIGFDFQVL